MSKGASELFSELPKPTRQVLGWAGVHTQSGYRACTFKDSTASTTAPTVRQEQAWAHSVLQLFRSAVALRSTNICKITEDLGFAGQNITKHLLQQEGQPRSKETQLARWLLPAPMPLEKGCKGSEAATRHLPPLHALHWGRRAVQAASCTHTLEKIRLNIANFALMSQLGAGSAAPFHFRKSGRNQLDLQESSSPCLLLWFQKDHRQDPTGRWGVLKGWPCR